MHAGEMTIVASGKANAVIIVPDAPSPVASYAANELQFHVQKATGVKLEIVPERKAGDVSPLKARIYVGTCERTGKLGIAGGSALGGFRIKCANNELFLVGVDGKGSPVSNDAQPTGTLFAVYEWLEGQLDVKWLWPGETGIVIRKTNDLACGDMDVAKEPPFVHTKLRYGGGYEIPWKGIVSEEARSKYIHETSVFLRRHRFARPVSFEYGHAFTKYWERFGKEHPEWFALRPDGKRQPLDTGLGQMCVSNPGLHKQIITDWLEQRRRFPGLPWINGAENDLREIDPSCGCEACRAWDPATPQILPDVNPDAIESDKVEGAKKMTSISLSDRYAKFWLALQEEGKKHDPNATVVGYAYGRYSEPPLETKLNKNIIVWITPPYYFPLSSENSERFAKIWDGWKATGARLVLRPNYFLAAACFPYIFAHQFGKEFKHAYENNLIGTDFDSLTSMWGTQGTNLYMLARIHEKPQMEVDAILDEYYSGFGAAAPHVKEYFTFLEKTTTERATADFFKKYPNLGWADFLQVADKLYTPEIVEKARATLAAAAEAVKNDSDAAAKVAFLEKGLSHTELELKAITTFNKQKAGGSKVEFMKAMLELDKYRVEIEKDNVVNIVLMNFLENRMGWNRSIELFMRGHEKLADTPLFWKFQWDPAAKGEAGKWYAPGLDDSNWLSARTDKPYENQAVGESWKKLNGANFKGMTWYRCNFSLANKAGENQKILLFFGAVDESCKIWLNGELALERKYDAAVNPNSWDESFTIDITSKVLRGGVLNTIAVEVGNVAGAGGIWKPVSIWAE
jgi:hypothetical protein